MDAKKNLKNTPQRNVIMQVLSNTYTHPTAVELYELVKEQVPGISLSTVYRNLDTLVGLGLVLRLDSGKGPARFDGHTNEHYHIRCIECGKVDDVPHQVKVLVKGDVQELSGYEVLGKNVEFYGLCPLCRGKKTK